jgi:hypothetical protein
MTDTTTPARPHITTGHTAPDRETATTTSGIAAPDGHMDPRELAQIAAQQFMTKTARRHPGNAASTLLRDLEQARVHVAALLAQLRP